MSLNAEELIEFYGLEKHPEGGYFRESYRAPDTVTVGRGERNSSTAIYFLLKAGDRSRLHRIKSDEVWHFYEGGPITVAQIEPDGRVQYTIMGKDAASGQKLQHAVPAGRWFGAFPCAGTEFSLTGCTVAPGFDFTDFELGERAALLEQLPGAQEIILKLTD
ncbi:MAG: cupin [Elusimicrobia bacterium CG1_02_56_21]|nr:MAG: cupin [Elusimicrobia bacterium CG1_02_56_21]